MQFSTSLNTGSRVKSRNILNNISTPSPPFMKECVFEWNEYILTPHTNRSQTNMKENNDLDLEAQKPCIYFIIYGKVQLCDMSDDRSIELGFDEYFISDESGCSGYRNNISVRAMEITKCEIFPLC